LYEAARSAGPETRGALLAGADAEVCRAVERMLDQPSAGTPLDQPAWAAEDASPSRPAIGAMLGPYRIDSRLGTGGMSVVYMAEDTRLRRFVAVKFLSEEFDGDRQAIKRFRREALAASALNHANICTIYDVGEQDGRSYMVMEYLEGATLKQRV